MNTRGELLKHLKENTRVLTNKLLGEVFKAVDRADFVGEDYKVEAYEDYALPIGYEQTISQPTVVAFMLEQLEPQKGDKVLDVGSGSGWTTALLARMVGEEGEVVGVERVAELVSFGKENLKKYDFDNAKIVRAKEALGLPEQAPFDRILVSASAQDESVTGELLEQLAPGGVMVASVGNSIIRYEKSDDKNVERKEFPGFVFVPLVSD